jgi:hypothetical protein
VVGLEWKEEGRAGDRFLEGGEGGTVKAGGGGEEECVVRIFEREAWEAEDEGRWICGGEKFDGDRLGEKGGDPGQLKEKRKVESVEASHRKILPFRSV